MINTEYLTQILLQSTKREDPAVFFRRVQREIWNMLPLFFPEIDDNGEGILDALSFDEFSKNRSFSKGVGRNDNYVSGRNLETAKLCSHALTISLPGESAHVKGQSDNTHVTDICIETAKAAQGESAAVRFSFMTQILYQPFAGFYPLAEKKYETPKIVESLLSLADSSAQFMPRLDCIHGAEPRYEYPIRPKVITIKDGKQAQDFLARLQDRARPIPFLVYMGDSGRMRAEAERMIPFVYAKAWVYVAERPELLDKMEEIVPGIDVGRDFKAHACRLFFPFGSYVTEDFANPSYTIKLWGRRRYRDQVLNGILRFFDIEEPGWRRTQRDIHMLQLELQEAREWAKKEDEINDSQTSVTKMQEVLSHALDKRKKEHEEIEKERRELKEDRELFESENKRLEGENEELSKTNEKLRGQNEALRQQLQDWKENGQQKDFKFGIESCYPNEVYDHLVEMLKMVGDRIPANHLRRRQIYDAIMKANRSSGELQKRKDSVAGIVRNKSEISSSDIKAFQRLGFTYSKEGPHHKFTMGSFCMIMPCTGSDNRGWRNSIRDFNRNFFTPSKGDD